MLEQLSANIWVAEGRCVDFHGFPYPTRSVLIRLRTGGLWVWSPIELTNTLLSAVEALGPVHHLVSPNKIHHLFLADWHSRFPEAKLWGPNSTLKKRKDLTFEAALTHVPPDDWAEEIEHFHVRGSFAMDEILFLHKNSRTLIVADFAENFGRPFLERNWRPWQRWIADRWGIVEGKGFAPLDWRLSFWNRSGLRQLRQNLQSRKVDHVVMAHGEIQRANGAEFLNQCLVWI